MNVKAALGHLVSAGRKAYKLDVEMRKLGYDNTPYADLYGEIADGIYTLIEDQAECFMLSDTYRLLTDGSVPDEHCVANLHSIFEERSVGSVQLNEATLYMICDAAKKRGVTVPVMIRLIINEWAIRQQFALELNRAV